MDRRHEVLAATVLAVVGLGIAAASLPASFAFEPPTGSDGSGGSVLLALLVALLQAFAELLGLPLPDRLGAPGGGSGLLGLVLAVARAAVPYLPAAVAALATLAIALLARALWAGRATVALGSARPGPGGTIDWTMATGPEVERRREWPPTEPDDPIGTSWIALVERAGVDAPATKTPAEIARTAVDDGMDERAVERLTAAFVETRYGRARPTDERCRQATAALDRLDA